jgi:hypothetical protein
MMDTMEYATASEWEASSRRRELLGGGWGGEAGFKAGVLAASARRIDFAAPEMTQPIINDRHG